MRDRREQLLVEPQALLGEPPSTPHGWKEHHAADITERRHALLREIAGER